MNYRKTHQPCPKCSSSDALAINEDGSTYCFACDRHTKPEDELIEEPMTNTPMNAKYLSSGKTLPITDRNITKDTCKAYGVTLEGTQQYYPFFNEDGDWIANKIRGKSYNGDKTFQTTGDWKQATLFGQNKFPARGKYVTLCEGELDALSAYQMMGSTWPVLSIRNGASGVVNDIEKSFEYLMSYDNIIICFDNDKPGKKAAKKAAELLSPKAKIVRLNRKDPNEYLVANDTDEFVKAWWNADSYTPDGIIAGTQLWDTLKEGPAKTAIEYPYDGMNRMTYGIRMGELITVCAGTGIGKSSFLKEIVKYIYDNTDDNIGMMFMEESVRSTAESMMSLELGKQLHLPDTVFTEEEYKQSYKDTVGSGRYFFFDHFGSNTIDNVLARVRYFAKAAKCKYVILDHISILVSSQEHSFDERRTIDECMTKLRTLVQELNISLVVVSHLRRPMQGSHEEGLNTSLSDLRGSASIGQLSDIVVGLERNGQADDPVERHTTYVRIIKNRFTGLTGLCTKLYYDFTDGRMREKSLDFEDDND